MRVVELQQRLALFVRHRQQLDQAPAHPGGIVEPVGRRLGMFATDLVEDLLQQRGQQRMLRSHRLDHVLVAPLHVGHLQAVVAHAHAVRMEAPRAAHAQGQQSIVAAPEILDHRFGAVRGGRGGFAGFLAVDEQADAEPPPLSAAVAHQVEVTRLEDAQAH